MRTLIRGALRVGVFAGAALWVAEGASAQELNWFWKDSLRAETEDGDIKFRLGARLHADFGWVDQSSDNQAAVGKFEDGAEMRRSRIYIQGDLSEDLTFKFQWDFSGGDSDFKDAYGGWRTNPVGTILIGQSKEPFGLEQLTSSNQITFMERSVADALVPGRSTGIVIGRPEFDNRVTWRTGFFRSMTDSYGDSLGNGDYAWTARVTGTPLINEEDDFLLHVGGNVSLRSVDDVRFRARPEAHLAPRYVDTGAIAGGDEVLLYAFETAVVCGPFSVQGEYNAACVDIDSPGMSDADFHGHYIEASYNLTGETRPYDSKKGVFKFLKPNKNLGDGDGCGAWTIAARYSGLDLSDSGIYGGELCNWTLGLNWHLNPNSRVMFNYVRADLDGLAPGIDSDVDNIFQMRFQLMF